MTGRGIDQSLPWSVDPALHELYTKNSRFYVKLTERHSGSLPDNITYNYIWGDALPELKLVDPDVCIINLETAVTNCDDHWPGKFIHYRMHPKNAELLNEAGIDVCVLGNNHVLDWGYGGLRETLQVLGKRGLAVAGAGIDSDEAGKPAVAETRSGRVLVFSYAHSSAGIVPDWGATENKPGINFLDNLDRAGIDKVIHDVESHRKPDDRIVISIHWGSNWGYDVPPSQQNFARRLLDAGAADLIHGHSSHHPKSIEVYNDRLILFGCGDLINDYEGISGHEKYRGHLSLLYFPELDSGGALLSLKMKPMVIRRFRLHHAEGEDVKWLAKRLNRECKKFGSSIELSEDGILELNW